MPTRKTPYALRILSHTFRLPSYIQFFETKQRATDASVLVIENNIQELRQSLASLTRDVDSLRKVDDRLIDLRRKIDLLSPQNTQAVPAEKAVNNTVSDNHDFDHFYKKFEDTFRGSEELIMKRLLEHIPLFQALPEDVKKKPVIDIGCGRGEMLRVMQEHGFKAIGVDMNKSMVDRATEAGFEAYQNDALSYLKTLETGSVAAITGFHIVEHIPFEALMSIFEECYRVIARGGFTLFETPNPESLTVGSHTFYLDPSHQRPIPPQLLSFMVDYSGFQSDIIRLHRIKTAPKGISDIVRGLFDTVYGNSDYAVVGRKA